MCAVPLSISLSIYLSTIVKRVSTKPPLMPGWHQVVVLWSTNSSIYWPKLISASKKPEFNNSRNSRVIIILVRQGWVDSPD